ncbi:glycerate kinase [Tessaracoccus sp. OS52]|uniref:glycerate kinase n=1 Tax=Tessaracoccus sp. OS52 TaxID=2886691 RepID=UPI001D0F4C6C|nr:glycerate kinase [Tessaracoccus sp. OS52]
MKVVIAPDSFKESMSAVEAARAMEEGVRLVLPEAECVLVPMSDGGEGFAQAVTSAWGAEWIEVDAVDALGRPLRAGFGMAGERAVVDIASTAGLERIQPGERDVANSSSAGLGILIRDAVGRGARRVVVGIGGSATNDAGAGMLVALGARLLDRDGRECNGTLATLSRVATVELSQLCVPVGVVEFLVASDVDNPLTGSRGATAVFGPQKGVLPQQVPEFDAVLGNFAAVAGKHDVAKRAGAGAAGGVGFALMAFLDASLRPGVEVLGEIVDLAEKIEGADLVLTGEGAVDPQTLHGKTPAGVARLAARAGVPTFLFAGQVRAGAERMLEHGVTRIIRIGGDGAPLDQLLAHGYDNLRQATARALEGYQPRQQ